MYIVYLAIHSLVLSIFGLFRDLSITALTKKDGGIRPIAVGCTLRRLVAKLACIGAFKIV